jgi:ribonuclease Z
MLDLLGLGIDGVSVGGLETCLCVPEYKLAFDIGRCPPQSIGMPTVLFTHAHVDHLGGVVNHCATRALRQMPPPRYIVPEVNAEAFARLMEVWRELDGGELPHEVETLAPGEDVQLRRGLRARAFHSPHRAPCQGYVIYDEREKLLPELASASSEELVQRRREGLPITATASTPELAFTGDTVIEGVLGCDDALRAKRLMIEVTFLDERVPAEKSHAMGHVHLDDIVEHAQAFENEALLFTHFSARYGPREIVRLLDERLPPSLRERVTPLLPRPS